MKKVFLDNASATALDPKVLKKMIPFFSNHFGNPSSIHTEGVLANNAIAESRKNIAEYLGAHPDEIIFTSGGTESNNLAIFGVCGSRNVHNKNHIISVASEHDSVLEPIERLKKNGFEVSFVKTDNVGRVNAHDVEKLINSKTVLISIMFANNEIGTIQPISEIGKMILKYRKKNNSEFPFFHSDACQAAAYIDLKVEKFHVDLLTINSGKINGPKGVGALYVRRGVKLEPQIVGGGQEKGLRSGTENVPQIVGFSEAVKIAEKVRRHEVIRLDKISKYFLKNISKIFPHSRLNGPEIGGDRLPSNLNLQFPGIDGEKMVIYLDSSGVLCSTASACSAKSSEPSHVLSAIGLTTEENRSSIRFSYGRFTKKSDIDYVLNCFRKIKGLINHL